MIKEEDVVNFSEIYCKDETNHLLTGNGFNMHFKYDSSYKNIFEKMIQQKKVKREMANLDKDFSGKGSFVKAFKDCNYDFESVFVKYNLLIKQRAELRKKECFVTLIKRRAELRKKKNAFSREEQYAQLQEDKDFVQKRIHTLRKFFIPLLLKIMQNKKRKRKGATKFIEKFINSNGNILTLNFDWLLYNIGRDLRNRSKSIDKSEYKINDGFIEDEDSFLWKEKNKQNLFFIHGGLHFYKVERSRGFEIRRNIKDEELRSIIDERDRRGEVLDIVFAGTSKGKRKQIRGNIYMKSALHKLRTLEGNLFLYGLSFSKNDNHIWKVIKKTRG